MNFVAIACDCCGAWILCPLVLRQGIGTVTPQIQLPVEKCPTCYEPFEPLVHTLTMMQKHQMPQGGGLIQ